MENFAVRFAEFEELVELFLQVWSCNVYCACGILGVFTSGLKVSGCRLAVTGQEYRLRAETGF